MHPRTRLAARSAALAASVPALLLAAGPALPQAFENVIFHANLDEHTGYSDVWGYTAPGGEEYALLGAWNGVAVINVTDPAAAYETGFVSGQFSTWRDIKTYQSWAYVTNESGGGLAILDLADPENPVPAGAYTGFNTAHNLFIDESRALAYIAGADLGSGGLRVLSLADPLSPVEVGSWEDVYLHDVVADGNRLYGSAIFAAQLVVLDVNDPALIPAPLGSAGGYPSAFTHNAWMDPDNLYVMTTDEVPGASVRMWDVSDPANIAETDTYRPNPAGSPHNVLIDGTEAYVAHYTAGVRVVDVSDPFAVQELGYWDTYAPNDGSTFDGCWGVFPFFGTTPGLFVASDIQTGLYVLEYRGPLGALSGRVTQNGTGAPVAGARVEVVETGAAARADTAGAYSLLDTGGAVTLRVGAFGHAEQQVPVTVVVGTTVQQDIVLDPLPGGSLDGIVLDQQTALPVPGAVVRVTGTPLADTADPAGAWAHPAVPSGTYTVEATAFGYDRMRTDVVMSAGRALTIDFPMVPVSAAEDFEAANPGWTVSGNALTGQWERADPERTSDLGQTVQSEDDHTASGVNAWVTGPLAGAAVGHHDVDGGATVLTTSLFDTSVLLEPRVSYHRWYSTGIGNPSVDTWTVEISSDAGASWTLLESVSQPQARWSLVDVAIDSLVVPTSQVAFRFTARDTGVGSITEAAIDDFQVYDTRSLTGTDVPAGPAEAALRLSSGFPNPFRAGEGTRIALALPAAEHVLATVHDVAGRRVATLADARFPAGPHRLAWDGRGDDGGPAAAGVYFLRLRSRLGDHARKLVILR